MSRYKHVLLVEDDRDDQEFFVEVFKEIAPCSKWEIAENGKEALDWLVASFPDLPDVIFLDLNMPVVNGFEFLRHIKADKAYEAFRGIPVFVLSTSSRHQAACYALGVKKYLTKPYSIQQFRAMLTEVLIDEI